MSFSSNFSHGKTARLQPPFREFRASPILKDPQVDTDLDPVRVAEAS